MNSAVQAFSQPQQPPPVATVPTTGPVIMGPFPQAPQVFTLYGKHAVQLAPLGEGNTLHFAITPDTAIFLNFDTLKTDFSRNENELTFTFEDASHITVTNYFTLANTALPSFILEDGREIEGTAFLTALYPLDFPIGP